MFGATGRSYDQSRFFAGVPIDGDDGIIESVTNVRQGERFFARHVIFTAVANLPMFDNFERQLL